MKSKLIILFLVVCFAINNSAIAQWQTPTLTNRTVRALAISGDSIFAGTDAGVYLSVDNGGTWNAINSGLTYTNIKSMGIYGSTIYLGAGESILNGSVYKKSISGASWVAINNGLPWSGAVSPQSFTFNQGKVSMATISDGIFTSSDNGANWSPSSITGGALSLVTNGVKVFAGTTGGVSESTDGGSSFIYISGGIPSGTDIYSLGVSGSNVFAGSDIDGIFISSDNGLNWTQSNFGLPDITNTYIKAFAFSGPNIFVGLFGDNGGVYRSANNGVNWTSFNANLSNADIFTLAVNDSYIFCGGTSGIKRYPLSQISGVNEINSENFFINIYPNPTDGSITVEEKIVNNEAITIEIKNTLGQTVYSFKEKTNSGLFKKEIKLNVEDGIYLLQMQSGQSSITKKIIVK